MGNAQANRRDDHDGMDARSPPDSPLNAPRSPLTFGPQIPTAPMSTPQDFSLGAETQPYPPQWSSTHALVPTPIIWSHGGNHVEVEGSFDNWTTRTPLHRNGKDFTVIKLLQPGVYQYKFIVDGEWKYAPEQPAMYDERGNVNNVIEVQEYQPENLDNLSSFQAPSSPVSSYDNPAPQPDDFAKEPPTAPPQLHLTLLNVPSIAEAPGILPRPQHVILNHLYSERSKNVRGATALGTTHRYRSKYITVVIYKAIGKQASKVDRAGVAHFMQQQPGGSGPRKAAGQ